MTQLESYKVFVREHGWNIRLGEILRTTFAAEYRKMATLLRQEGWIVEVKIDRKNPGCNLYTFKEPMNIVTGSDGQRAFL